MNREEKERRARMQRMLARERGETPPPGTEPEEPAREPARPGRPAPKAGQDADPEESRRPRTGNTRPLSPILQRRRRRKRNLLIALVLVIALGFAVLTGVFSTSIAMLGDLADSVALTFEPGGWPASTGITDPLQIEELAGGFVELDSTDVAVFSSHGAKVRTIQPGYARPAIAVGNTRFALYNRAGAELRIESRTGTLYTHKFSSNILLCAMSANGTTAVVTESSRYAAAVEVYDPMFEALYEWYPTQTDGTPVALAFASDNRRFAAGCLSAAEGQLCTKLFFMDLGADAPTATYTADPGSMILHLYWLADNRVLAVFDDGAVLLNAADGTEVARYDYGGATLLDVDTAGRGIALLLSGQSDSTLVVLDNDLKELAHTDAGASTMLCCTRTNVYLAGGTLLRRTGYDGETDWEQTLENPAIALLNASMPLVFSGTQVWALS